MFCVFDRRATITTSRSAGMKYCVSCSGVPADVIAIEKKRNEVALPIRRFQIRLKGMLLDQLVNLPLALFQPQLGNLKALFPRGILRFECLARGFTIG